MRNQSSHRAAQLDGEFTRARRPRPQLEANDRDEAPAVQLCCSRVWARERVWREGARGRGFSASTNLPADLIGALATTPSPRSTHGRHQRRCAQPREPGGCRIVEKERSRARRARVFAMQRESWCGAFRVRRPHPLARDGPRCPEATRGAPRLACGRDRQTSTPAPRPAQLRGCIQDLVVTDRFRLTLVLRSFASGGSLDAATC